MTRPAFAAEEDRIRDAYARRQNDARYSWFNPAHVFMAQAQERAVLEALRDAGYTTIEQARILDVGCGTGVAAQFRPMGRAEHTTELTSPRTERSRQGARVPLR